MKDLKFYTQYAKTLLDSLNIPYVDYPVEINMRLTRTWGMCYKSPRKYIALNHVLLLDDTDDDALMNTLLHEYLHTCPKCFNHGKEWKRYAKIVNDKYHYNIQTRTSSEEKGLDKSLLYKYELSCPECGHTWYFGRKSNAVKGALVNHIMTCPCCGYKGRGWKLKTNF